MLLDMRRGRGKEREDDEKKSGTGMWGRTM